MKTLVTYSNKSSVTGKEIAAKFDALRKRTNKKAKCDLFIRWGSTEEFARTKAKLELNTLDAVNRTVNKLDMLITLSAAGIPVPEFGNTIEEVVNNVDAEGNQYIRNKYGVVRYGNDFSPDRDKYFTKPVKSKRREYRVHVFNGKVIGLYEKVPNAEVRPKLFKQDTCSFKRRDPELCLLTKDDQAQCIKSVQALGLLFGGVDVIRDAKKNIFICEVNSAPGLNGMNIDRWVEEIKLYATEQGITV